MTTTPDFFTPDAELKAENLELKRECGELRTRVANLLVDLFYKQIDVDEAERRGYQLAMETIAHYAKDAIIQNDYQRSKEPSNHE